VFPNTKGTEAHLKDFVLKIRFPTASRDHYVRILHRKVRIGDRTEIAVKREQAGVTTTPEVRREMPRLMTA